MKKMIGLFVAAAALGVSASASAQFAKTDDAIKYRKNAFFVMSQHFGRIGAMATGKVPFDAKVAAENAAIVDALAKLPLAGFVDGSDLGDTRALPEIWKEKAKFHAAGDKMVAELGKLNTAAKTGNLDEVKKAFQGAAASCKACHDDFRAK